MKEFQARIALTGGEYGYVSIVRNALSIGNKRGLFEIAYISPSNNLLNGSVMGNLTASDCIAWVKRFKNEPRIIIMMLSIELNEAMRSQDFLRSLDITLEEELVRW